MKLKLDYATQIAARTEVYYLKSTRFECDFKRVLSQKNARFGWHSTVFQLLHQAF